MISSPCKTSFLYFYRGVQMSLNNIVLNLFVTWKDVCQSDPQNCSFSFPVIPEIKTQNEAAKTMGDLFNQK